MKLQVDLDTCAGCGVCVEACPQGAIQLLDYRAVIDQARCTGCQACVEACPNGAIQPVAEPALSLTSRVEPQPTPLSLVRPVPQVIHLPNPTNPPAAAPPFRTPSPLARAALAFLNSDLAPRLLELLATVIERKPDQPSARVATAPPFTARRTAKGGKGIRQQKRLRGRQAMKGNRPKKT